MTTFDLVDQPWVPVIKGGQRADVSLREALLDAGRLGGLAFDAPLEATAVLRQVLLPVLFDALGVPRSPQEWADRFASGSYDVGHLEEYLIEHRGRFDLFDAVAPFAQVAGLHTANHEVKPVTYLLAEAASGNNVPLFSTRTEADPPALTPAQAARALLATHCWDTAAIKSGAVGDPRVSAGKTTGNPTGPLGRMGVIVPHGRTLKQTLDLNTPVLRHGLDAADQPQWRDGIHTPAWNVRHPRGELDLLTWQSRRIRLVVSPPETTDESLVVRHAVVAAGDRIELLNPDREWHCAWRAVDKPKAGEAPQRPVSVGPSRPQWTNLMGLPGLLTITGSTPTGVSSSRLLAQVASLQVDGWLPDDLALTLTTTGVSYGNQQAVVEDLVHDSIPLPVLALIEGSAVRELVLRVAGQVSDLHRAANNLADDLRVAQGAAKAPWDKGQRIGDLMLHRLGVGARRLLGGLQRQPDRVNEAERAWTIYARQVAREMADLASTTSAPRVFAGVHEGDSGGVRNLSTALARYWHAVSNALPKED